MLKDARESAGMTQQEAAEKLGLTQAYLSMLERGVRPVTAKVTAQAGKVFRMPPTALPLSTADAPEDARLKEKLGALGYPGFRYLRSRTLCNPAQVLLCALDVEDQDRRVVEALPWLVCAYPEMDWGWLGRHARMKDRQNRLGFVTDLAEEMASRRGDGALRKRLEQEKVALERSRLAHEDTLAHGSMTEVERKWLRQHRTAQARHWNLLTDLEARHLAYVTV